MARDPAWERHDKLRKQYGGLIGPRQRAAARKRKLDAETPDVFRIRWDDTETWRLPSTEDPQRIIEMPFPEMDDKLLWTTLNWAIRNCEVLYIDYVAPTNDRRPVALAARLWLRDRSLFRAIARECIRRGFTYPKDIQAYLKHYLLDKNDTLEGYTPWRDPAHAQQADELKSLSDLPLLPPEAQYGKSLRAIDLSAGDDK